MFLPPSFCQSSLPGTPRWKRDATETQRDATEISPVSSEMEPRHNRDESQMKARCGLGSVSQKPAKHSGNRENAQGIRTSGEFPGPAVARTWFPGLPALAPSLSNRGRPVKAGPGSVQPPVKPENWASKTWSGLVKPRSSFPPHFSANHPRTESERKLNGMLG